MCCWCSHLKERPVDSLERALPSDWSFLWSSVKFYNGAISFCEDNISFWSAQKLDRHNWEVWWSKSTPICTIAFFFKICSKMARNENTFDPCSYYHRQYTSSFRTFNIGRIERAGSLRWKNHCHFSKKSRLRLYWLYIILTSILARRASFGIVKLILIVIALHKP